MPRFAPEFEKVRKARIPRPERRDVSGSPPVQHPTAAVGPTWCDEQMKRDVRNDHAASDLQKEKKIHKTKQEEKKKLIQRTARGPDSSRATITLPPLVAIQTL